LHFQLIFFCFLRSYRTAMLNLARAADAGG